MVRRALVWVVAGCNFAPAGQAVATGDGGSGSAGSDASHDGVMVDALDPSRDCMPEWQAGSIGFYPPVELAELSTPGTERDPFLSPDELTIYYSGELGSNQLDVLTATRAHVGDRFGTPSVFAPASSPSSDTKMSISIDQLTLVACQYNGSGNFDVIATRASTSDPWPPLSAMHMMMVDGGSNTNAFDPELGSDGTMLIFSPTTATTQSLAMATRPNTGGDFAIMPIPGYMPDMTYRDADPWFDAAGRLLLFTRSISGGNGDTDIYYAVGSGGMYGTPARAPDINSTGAAGSADGDAWVSPNGCRIYFSSNRPGGSGDYDLYVANAR